MKPDSPVFIGGAPQTIQLYVEQMEQWLDERYGEGFAQKHPELLGQLVQACAMDLHTTTVSMKLRELKEAVECTDLVERSVSEIINALGLIAEAIEGKSG